MKKGFNSINDNATPSGLSSLNYQKSVIVPSLRDLIYGALTISLFSCSPRLSGLPDSLPCDLSGLTPSISENYDFTDNFSDSFSQSTRWNSRNADIQIVDGKGQLTANSEDVSRALEAWKLYKDQMPYDRSWEFAVEIHVPLYWNENGGKEAQVGAGPFAGRPVANGQSPKVYECNMAAITNEFLFVQAQLIKNRLTGDPDDVQFKKLTKSKEKAVLKIQYCADHHSLGFFIDDEQVGKSKAIDKDGADDWDLDNNGKIDVGIMGFAENTVITSYTPTLDNVTVKIY